MEFVISIGLGIWIALAGVVSFAHYKNDEKRENRK